MQKHCHASNITQFSFGPRTFFAARSDEKRIGKSGAVKHSLHKPRKRRHTGPKRHASPHQQWGHDQEVGGIEARGM
eukprot:1150147-Pelagomonas_calceolata.AAC.5